MVLSFNYHPSPITGTWQILCHRKNEEILTEKMRKKILTKLPINYNPVGLLPNSINLGEMKQRALRQHRLNVMQNWERYAKKPRNETVVMLFEQKIQKYQASCNRTR